MISTFVYDGQIYKDIEKEIVAFFYNTFNK